MTFNEKIADLYHRIINLQLDLCDTLFKRELTNDEIDVWDAKCFVIMDEMLALCDEQGNAEDIKADILKLKAHWMKETGKGVLQ